MKVVILAGGKGTRISEESHLRPKPMIEIGGLPILVHLMRNYAAQGFNDFIICAGYKQEVIKDYFANYNLYANDVMYEFGSENKTHILSKPKVNWKVSVINTGYETNTAGRVRKIRQYIGDEPFMLTYGDGLADIDLQYLLDSHKKSGKLGTVSVYNFGQNKGVVDLDKDNNVVAFREKSDYDGDLINIGFMVLEPKVFDLIGDDDSISFENGPMKRLTELGQLNAYVHHGFWQCMDTISEREKLEKLWASGHAPWKNWED